MRKEFDGIVSDEPESDGKFRHSNVPFVVLMWLLAWN